MKAFLAHLVVKPLGPLDAAAEGLAFFPGPMIGDGLDLLAGHGGHDREAQTKRGDDAFAFGPSEVFAALVEDRGIEDGLELVGRGGKVNRLDSFTVPVLSSIEEVPSVRTYAAL
jgi:hypothetical protein